MTAAQLAQELAIKQTELYEKRNWGKVERTGGSCSFCSRHRHVPGVESLSTATQNAKERTGQVTRLLAKLLGVKTSLSRN